jgi:hypothetical protein
MVSFLAMTQMSILIMAQLTKPFAQYEVKDLPVRVKGQSVKLTTYVHLVPRLKRQKCVPSLSYTSS